MHFKFSQHPYSTHVAKLVRYQQGHQALRIRSRDSARHHQRPVSRSAPVPGRELHRERAGPPMLQAPGHRRQAAPLHGRPGPGTDLRDPGHSTPGHAVGSHWHDYSEYILSAAARPFPGLGVAHHRPVRKPLLPGRRASSNRHGNLRPAQYPSTPQHKYKAAVYQELLPSASHGSSQDIGPRHQLSSTRAVCSL